jgi:hypothetical protein
MTDTPNTMRDLLVSTKKAKLLAKAGQVAVGVNVSEKTVMQTVAMLAMDRRTTILQSVLYIAITGNMFTLNYFKKYVSDLITLLFVDILCQVKIRILLCMNCNSSQKNGLLQHFILFFHTSANICATIFIRNKRYQEIIIDFVGALTEMHGESSS